MLAALALALLPAPLQAEDTPTAPPPDAARVEALRQRIHGMRQDLLLGGEKVRQAESDAAQFYRGKVEVIEQRLDGIASELAERRAAYRVALERALSAEGDEARPAALREAAEQRAQIEALETEAAQLGERSARVAGLIGAVEARGRERERLATRVESAAEDASALFLPMGGIGLAPAGALTRATSPLEDETLIQDLLALDPRSGRKLLFESDPAGYWKRFPLQPPAEVLPRALAFPPADLPGQR
jgi:hypothetical protein